MIGDNDARHFIFTTDDGGLLDVKTDKFFIGTTGSQFISGSNQNIEIKDQKDDNDHLVVWSLDKDAWRSFRVNTVIEWYVGREKKESNKRSSN